jgi:16S rRNA (cytosine1402-N4)-methyltransferase
MTLTMMKPIHKPVLLQEVKEALDVAKGKRFIDCTLGLGGHAASILKDILPSGNLLGIDADPEAMRIAVENLREFGDSKLLVNDNFVNLKAICEEYDFLEADGVLFDLGVSSLQLDSANRGFSFQQEADLDMRFNPDQVMTATDLVNILPEDQLAQLLFIYGEEQNSRKIAHAIVQNRPVDTTLQLAEIVERIYGGRHGRIHPATKTFQALRIVVNAELENLRKALSQVPFVLKKGGRLVVISYHSLEDRIVKQFMKEESTDCICPPKVMVCNCGHKASLKILSSHVVIPTELEIDNNPRSRSAKLRVAERL